MRLILTFLMVLSGLAVYPQDTLNISKFERSICLDKNKDDYKKSIEYFQKIVAKDSLDLESQYNLAMSYYKMVDSLSEVKAINVWDYIISKDSCFNYALVNRGICKLILKDKNGFCQDIKRASKCSYPDMSDIKYYLENDCKDYNK